MSSTFSDYVQSKRNRVNTALSGVVVVQADPETSGLPELTRIAAASSDALTNGGKRIRAILLYSAHDAIQPSSDAEGLDNVACSIELIHSYSLVHDDLPAMDDDDLRRGQPSCHKAYDEPTAILVGDGLQARAFELIADASGFNDFQRIAMIKALAKASGLQGMVGGQAIDITSVGASLSLEQLQTMHSLKTGALIRAALAMGGIAGNASNGQLTALDDYGSKIGLAFQVVDDILDVEGNTATLGKTQGKDDDANKPTYVKLMGLEGAKDEAQRLLEEALTALNGFGESADNLRDLARYIVERDR
jgi:farnesyl diphosphate synthase/geranylgeranyl diphosphate synthase type II